MKAAAATALFLSLLTPAAADAGTSGVLTGSVVDEKQSPVSDVTVSIASPAFQCRTTTDARGNFTFIALPPDRYIVRLERETYAPTAYSGIIIFTDESLHLSLHMERARTVIIRDNFGPRFPYAFGGPNRR